MIILVFFSTSFCFYCLSARGIIFIGLFGYVVSKNDKFTQLNNFVFIFFGFCKFAIWQIQSIFKTNLGMIIAVFIVYEGLDLAVGCQFAAYEQAAYVLVIGAWLFAFGNLSSVACFVYNKWRFHREASVQCTTKNLIHHHHFQH
jgi:TctA family transporter